jgi:hypothetical protein
MGLFLTAEGVENAEMSKGGFSNRWEWRSIAYLQELPGVAKKNSAPSACSAVR